MHAKVDWIRAPEGTAEREGRSFQAGLEMWTLRIDLNN